jgi:CcmD family protein
MDPHTLSLMYARNFTFMFYGFSAAWLIIAVYVISLARRGARLKKELEDVRRLPDSADSPL